MRTLVGLLIAAWLTIPAAGVSQEALAEGELVRVTGIDGSRVTGIVAVVTAEALTLDVDPYGPIAATPWSDIAGIERSLGKERRFGKYFGVTVAASVGALGLLGAGTYSDTNCTGFCIGPDSAGQAFLWGAFVGTLIGVPLGVVLGLTLRGQRWGPMMPPMPHDFGLSIMPTDRGLGIVGSIPIGR